MVAMLDHISLNTQGVRVMKPTAYVERDPGAPLFWQSKVDVSDQRLQLLNERWKRSDVAPEELRNISFYEWVWKFYHVKGRHVRFNLRQCIMLSPGFSADSASVLHPRHGDYARTAIVAHWRMMPTAERHAIMAAWHDNSKKPFWGHSLFTRQVGRFLGIQDLVRMFDGRRKDRTGRDISWAFALLEMLVDPVLSRCVPA